MAVSVATLQPASILSQIRTLPASERRIFYGVTWMEYQKLLDDLGEHRSVLVSFSKGVLEIMPLSRGHEHHKELVSGWLLILSEELDMNIEPNGSTTLQLEALQSGVEPDTSFFIRHADLMVGKATHDLHEDPPPDLVFEIDISHPRYSKKEIYSRMGVPEFWQYNGEIFKIFSLAGSDYVEVESSPSFPFIRSSDLESFLERSKSESRLSSLRNFREWAKANKPTE